MHILPSPFPALIQQNLKNPATELLRAAQPPNALKSRQHCIADHIPGILFLSQIVQGKPVQIPITALIQLCKSMDIPLLHLLHQQVFLFHSTTPFIL